MYRPRSLLSPGLLHAPPYTPRRAFSRTARCARKQHSIPVAYYRGGTSRALIFHAKDLPADRTAWAPIFRGALGSPDPHGRQLDGMGGGVSSLSKVSASPTTPSTTPATAAT
ncbi:hypothetical protein VTN02DRAFT_1319 [Thermoascus thermophilus]